MDNSYIPLNDNAYLTDQVIKGNGTVGGRARGVRSLPSSTASEETTGMRGPRPPVQNRQLSDMLVNDHH